MIRNIHYISYLDRLGERDLTLEWRRERFAPDRFSLALAEREVLLQRGEIGSAEPVRRTADDLNRMKWRFSKLVRYCPDVATCDPVGSEG